MMNQFAILGGMAVVASLAMSIPATAQGLVSCAGEGGYCRVPYPTTVVYGGRGSTTSREVGGGGIPCNNRAFGDPAPGVVKHCSFVARGGGGYEQRGYDRPRDYDRGYDRGPDRGYERRRRDY